MPILVVKSAFFLEFDPPDEFSMILTVASLTTTLHNAPIRPELEMMPGTKGEGAHNEPQRGSLGNEEIPGETQRGSTVRPELEMTPGAKGEGAHNEPQRGSLGNEEIPGETQRGSTVGPERK